ncbi:hypothetical protein PV326_013169 [Microctonus aethiopoides]|nr:hypothetical protein PV326_013169 [Microctonus aethiopoides]
MTRYLLYGNGGKRRVPAATANGHTSARDITCESTLTDPLTILKNKIETTIDSAINEINSKLNETNKQIDNISEKLINASEEFSQAIYNRVIRQLKKMNEKLNNLTNSDDVTSKNESHVDFTECKKISESMDLLALMAYSNMSQCVIEKIEFGGGYSESIKKIADDVLANLSMTKNDINNCSDNFNFNIKSNAKTMVCLNSVAAKATWIAGTSVPDIILKITNLMSKMLSLQIELPFCAVTNGIEDLSDKYTGIYDETKKCVEKKRSGHITK